MSAISADAMASAVVVLVAGFGYAAIADLRRREVSDRLWQLMGLVGLVVGAVAVSPGGAVPILLWAIVAALVLEHMFPWDSGFGDFWAGQADRIELGAYVGVIIVVAVAITRVGINAHGVPWAVVAVLAVVVAARGLFELGVLYGGADAKALMISGLLVPVLSTPLVFTPPHAPSALSYLPFPVSLLTNAALFSIAVPLGLAIHNARRREFSFSKGFMGYSLAVEELPNRFVWVKDPAVPFDPSTDDAETSADDARERRRIARDLKARGIRRVWVTPQVPFLAVMAAGAVAAVLAGNLLLDAFLWI